MDGRREEDPELYITYKPQIDRFLADCLYKGRINRDLAFLYRRNLKDGALADGQGRMLAALLGSREVFVPEEADAPRRKKLVALHSRLKGEEVWMLQEGRACIGSYGGETLLFTEDENQNRRLLRGGRAEVTPLFEKEDVLFAWSAQELAEWGRDCLSFRLFAAEQQEVCPENEACYLALVWEPRLEEAYARTLRGRLLSYLEEEGRQKELKSLLKELEKDQLDPAGSLAAAGMLVMQGFYEKAYGWLAGEDLSRLDPGILLRLGTGIL